MEEFHSTMAHQFEILHDIWREIGCSTSACERKTDKFKELVLSHMQGLVDGERTMYLQMLNSANILENELQSICEFLNAELPVFDNKLGLGSKIKFYEKLLDNFKKQKQAMEENFNKVWTNYYQICSLLGEKLLDKPCLGNETVLVKLKSELKRLEKLQLERKEKVDKLLHKIFEINAIITEPISCDLNTEKLDSGTIVELENILNDLEVRLRDQETKSENLRSQILCLWKRMPDSDDMNEWLAIHSGYDKDTIELLRDKLDSLQRERMKNLPRFIESLKLELKEYWGKCYISEKERQSYNCPVEVSEDSVIALEKEIQRYKSYYEEARQVFDLFNKWNSSREELEVLERNAKDPSRLNNRGGRLLKEERRKNHLVKIIPELEKKLVDEARLWKMDRGCDFVIYGKTIAEVFHEDQVRKRVLKDSVKRNRPVKSNQNLTAKSPKKFDRTFKRFKCDSRFETELDIQDTAIYPEASDTLSTISSLTDFAEGIEERNRNKQSRSSSKNKRRRSKSAEPMHYSQRSPGFNRTNTRLSPHHKCMSRLLKSPKLETKFTPFKPFLI